MLGVWLCLIVVCGRCECGLGFERREIGVGCGLLDMDQGQGYGHSYMPQPPLPISSGGVPQIPGMQQYAPPPPPFPYHAPQYSYPQGPARSAAIPAAATPLPPQGGGLGLASGFFNPWEPPPAPVQPPVDNDLQKRIDKLVEYACKNGPQFEALMKDKQKENPLYAFLFGAEGHDYYRYKLWQTLNPVPNIPPPTVVPSYNPALAALSAAQNASLAPGLAGLNPSMNPTIASPLKPALSAAPPVAPPTASFSSGYYEQPHHPQPFYDQFQHECYGGVNYQQAPVVPHSGPLPPDVSADLRGLLENLTGTRRYDEHVLNILEVFNRLSCEIWVSRLLCFVLWKNWSTQHKWIIIEC